MKLTATLIPKNQVNLNGRIYRDNENLREAIKEFNERKEKTGVVYGQLGYPSYPMDFNTHINQVSHTIENVRIENNKVKGEIKILDTPNGRILKDNINNYVFRSRGAGSTNIDGSIHLSKLFTYDAIHVDEDAFNMNNKPKEKEYKRIYSDIDPYGEEEWE